MTTVGTTTIRQLTAHLPDWLSKRCTVFSLQTKGIPGFRAATTLFHLESRTVVQTSPSPSRGGWQFMVARPGLLAAVGFGSPWQRPRIERGVDRKTLLAGWFGLSLFDVRVPMLDALSTEMQANAAEMVLRAIGEREAQARRKREAH